MTEVRTDLQPDYYSNGLVPGHSDSAQSAYEGFNKAELREEADTRGLDVASNATKADLVAALEAADTAV